MKPANGARNPKSSNAQSPIGLVMKDSKRPIKRGFAAWLANLLRLAQLRLSQLCASRRSSRLCTTIAVRETLGTGPLRPKKRHYRVGQYETWLVKYNLEADSAAEAIVELWQAETHRLRSRTRDHALTDLESLLTGSALRGRYYRRSVHLSRLRP
jgi:hypothetical protein